MLHWSVTMAGVFTLALGGCGSIAEDPGIDAAAGSTVDAAGGSTADAGPGAADASGACADGGAQPCEAVTITAFTATSPLQTGASTAIGWIAQHATSCIATGELPGWSGSVAPSGTMNLVVAVPGTFSLTLSCEGNQGPVSRTISVMVSCNAPPLSGVTETWLAFWGVPFPGPTYDNKTSWMSNPGYKAFEFNTGTAVDDGMLVTVENTTSEGVRLGAVSRCPGDFAVAAECRHSWGIGGGIRWATNGRAGACALEANTTYYFNLTFGDGVNPAASSCAASQCLLTLQHVNAL